MGYIRHDAIVVIGNPEAVDAARAKAVSYGLLVTEALDTPINGERTFAVLPDGSKEGWDVSNMHAKGREKLVEWMGSYERPVDELWYLDWAHVTFGGDDRHIITAKHGNSP